MSHIAVIGAGVTGVTSAYALLAQGHEVSVFDGHRYPAMETSFANGGQLSASNAEVWNSWATMLKGIKWMLRGDAPLLFNPSPSIHKYSWVAEFIGKIRNYKINTQETVRLAILAREMLFKMAEQEGINFDLKERGILHLYYNKPAFEVAERANRLLVAGGLERRAVTPQEILAIEPTLHGQFFGGFYTPSDSTGDIHKFTRGLAAACERKGARFLMGRSVKQIRAGEDGVEITATSPNCQRGEIENVDAVVICAGVKSRDFAAMLGDRINIYPVKGYSITVCLNDQTSQASAPTVSLLDEDAKIVTSRLGNDRFRVAGTAEFNGYNKDIRADRIDPLVRWAARMFPGMPTDSVIPWAGLRPMTPSMLPRTGRGNHRRVYYNTGHGHLGWTLSAATAQLLAQQVGPA